MPIARRLREISLLSEAGGYLLEGPPGIGKTTAVAETLVKLAEKQQRKIFYAQLKELSKSDTIPSLWSQLGRNVKGGKRLL